MHERLEGFASVASVAVNALGLEKSAGRGPRGEPASERVIRDYVRRRVLSPTGRAPETGERGWYGFRHLAEFLAARVLANDGWPLDKIAERNRTASIGELIALIPGQNPALALARSFRIQASQPHLAEEPAPFAASAMSAMQESARPRRPLVPDATAVSAARRRAELPLLMRELTGEGKPPRVADVTSIALGEHVTLLIDSAMVRDITPEKADRIGRTVSAALLDYQNLSKPRGSENDD
jgi:hypothetical protein